MESPARHQATIESLVAQLGRLLSEAPEVTRRMGSLRATRASGDGIVTATVDHRGRLVDLEIDPAVFRAPDATALAAAVLEATQAADGAVRDGLRVAVGAYVPEDLARRVLDPLDTPRAEENR